jgi:cytochrome c553
LCRGIMTRRITVLATVAIIATSLQPVRAADVAAGQAKAKICATCHGRAGISTAPLFPNLAGQKSAYLAEQLRMFRSGERKSEQMNIIAKALSDEDIENLAAYFEGLHPGGS